MSSPGTLMHRYGEPRLPGPAWLIMGLLTAAIFWTYSAKIERIVVAQGRVAPRGEVKVIQHLEGGIIEAFHVSEGERVAPGDPLITLNLGGRGINRPELQARLDRRHLTRARLEAEATGQPVQFPAEIAERHPVLLASEQAAFAARQLELESALKVLEQQKRQRQHRIAELRAEYQAVRRSLRLDHQELAVQKELYSQKLASELTLIATRRRVEDRRGRVEILDRTIVTHEAEVAEFSARTAETIARFHRQAQDDAGTEANILAEELGQLALVKESIETLRTEVAEFSARTAETIARFRRLAQDDAGTEANILAEELGQLALVKESIETLRTEVAEFSARTAETIARFGRQAREEASSNEGEITALKEQLRVADEQRGRSVIRSPIEGEVKNFRYHTVGGVIRPGEAVLEIVPLLEQLVIDAKLQPADRGFIDLGMDADIKVTAYDFVRYGSLPGRISHIAPDTSFDENIGPYYRVVLDTQRSYLGSDPAALRITPGMTALVEIKVGMQSVLNALIRPVLKTRAEAFREP